MLDSTEHWRSESSEVKLKGASGGSRECQRVIRVERQSVRQLVCLQRDRNKSLLNTDLPLKLRQHLKGVTVNEVQSLYIWLCDAAGQLLEQRFCPLAFLHKIIYCICQVSLKRYLPTV